MNIFRLLYIFLFAIIFPCSEASNIRFIPIGGELSNWKSVHNIYQDSNNYIWLSTDYGLNRLSGKLGKSYMHSYADSLSIPNNYVISSLEDGNGHFWIMGGEKLSLYDKQTESFKEFSLSNAENRGLSLVAMVEDRDNGSLWVLSRQGFYKINTLNLQVTNCFRDEIFDCIPLCCMLVGDKLWIGGDNGVLLSYNVDSNEIREYSIEGFRGKRIVSMCNGSNGKIWLSVLDGGIFSFDTLTYEFNQIHAAGEARSAIKMSHSIIKDSKGRIWIGTEGYGLWQLDEDEGSIERFEIGNTGFNHRKGKISCLFEDKNGNIWVPYIEKGLVVIPGNVSGIRTIENDYFSDKRNISDNSILSVIVDSDNKLWVGTNGGGLYIMKPEQGNYSVVKRILPDENVITSILQDSEGMVYIGTYLHGVYVYNPAKDQYKQLPMKKDGFLLNYHIVDIAEDKYKNIWFATQGGGLVKKCADSDRLIFYASDSENDDFRISNNFINSLALDNDKLWIGTGYGVNCIDIETGVVINNPMFHQFVNNQIMVVCFDGNGKLWAGTRSGLNSLDLEKKEIRFYTDKDGLPDNFIMSMEYDPSTGLWISTNGGLARFDVSKEEFIDYDERQGVENIQYKERSSVFADNGIMYFGGNKGIIFFNPQKLKYEKKVSEITFSNLYLAEKKIGINDTVAGNVILNKSLNEVEEIVLSYKQNSISIDYDAFVFSNPSIVTYKYKLEGFDETWNTTIGDLQRAVYTNLHPGDYVFKVRAFIGDESLAVEKSLHILVKPPFWLSFWAKTIYFIILILIVVLVFKIIKSRIKEKRQILEQQQREKISQARLQMFTDISHEIRTPLTLILSPLKKLMSNEHNSHTAVSYHIMYKNGMRILRMVNQLLDLRKLEKGQMSLKVERVNLDNFISDTIDSFRGMVEDKGLQLHLEMNDLPEYSYFDIDILDKIIYNLVSNAVKYTPAKGEVNVRVYRKDENFIKFEIEDTGIGISKKNINSIFNRFYRVEDQTGVGNNGSGIGLHLTKSLVEMHHGEISVQSELGKGSCFMFVLPFKEESYNEGEKKHNEENARFEESVLFSEKTMIESDIAIPFDENTIGRKKKYKVLIVEDDEDIRSYLKLELGKYYQVFTAVNGKIGYDMAVKELPDIIISDIMMPEINGLEMMKKLRSNPNVCDIPVILLTAKACVEDFVSGLQKGADAYLAKPFELSHLIAQINNLLQRSIHYKVQKSEVQNNRKIDETYDVKSADDKLIEKLNAKIKERIGDSSLSIEELSAECGISRVHLHRKLKELYQQSPSVYLRNIRLEHAAYLLRTKNISISEVAFAVGFNSQQYFTNCFKETYGVSPSVYASKENSEKM